MDLVVMCFILCGAITLLALGVVIVVDSWLDIQEKLRRRP